MKFYWYEFIMGFLMGLSIMISIHITWKQDFQAEIVKKGFAHWKIDDYGRTTWEWNESK